MDKKYIAGGFIFWIGVSGYMGLRILESYTEDAVFAALSAVPAQAQEIKYSFLENSLMLKGVEYEFPDDKIMHKGTIESVSVKGFNRKCMFVKPGMPPYDADTLPIVAQGVTLQGVVDNLHVGKTKITQKVDEIKLEGWYQRLGMLLDQKSQHKGEESFYEEMYRCRIDELEMNSLAMEYVKPDAEPLHASVEKIALAGGIRAPRGIEKTSLVSMYLEGLRFSGRSDSGEAFSGGVQRMDIKDFLPPSPAVLAAFNKFSSEKEETLPEMTVSSVKKMEQCLELFQKNYADRNPLSLFGMQGVNFAFGGDASQKDANSFTPFSLSVNGFSCMFSQLNAESRKNTVNLSALHINSPVFQNDAVLKRYAAEGITLNMNSEAIAGAEDIVWKSRYELEGLGKMEGDLAVSGERELMQKLFGANMDSVDPYQLMQKIQVNRMNFTYDDSGLLALCVELSARRDGISPEEEQKELFHIVDELSEYSEKKAKELGNALREQFTSPGQFSIAFTPSKPMTFMKIGTMLFSSPDELPVFFASKAGEKPLKEYLKK